MNNVTLSQVRAFERTVRLGGVHAAARHLGLTQPAVSQRIRDLERALGVTVFVRSGRSLRITPDGVALLAYADQLLNTADEMFVRLSTRDPLSGVLRLGVSASFARVALGTLLERLDGRFPSLKTSIFVGDSNAISEMLNEQKLDLAVTSEYKIAAHIHREKIGVNRHGWFASPSIEVDQVTQTPNSLAQHHLIITPPPARHNASVMQWFRQVGIVPTRLSTCNDLSITVRMILSGLGIGAVPVGVMRPYVRQRSVRQLSIEPEIQPYDVWVCYQVEELGPGLRHIVDIIREIVVADELYV